MHPQELLQHSSPGTKGQPVRALGMVAPRGSSRPEAAEYSAIVAATPAIALRSRNHGQVQAPLAR